MKSESDIWPSLESGIPMLTVGKMRDPGRMLRKSLSAYKKHIRVYQGDNVH